MTVNGRADAIEFGGTAHSCIGREFETFSICKHEVHDLASGREIPSFCRIDSFALRGRWKGVSVIFTARWGMASSLEKKQIDELLAKYRASAEREQRRVDELERRNAHFVEQISSSLIVPASAFATSYARAYYGDEASSICGVPIDAAAGLLLKALATLLGFSSDKGPQTAAKFLHDFANGALASWTTKLGADFGAKKRMEKPLPAPRPHTGAEGTPERAPGPIPHEEFAAITAATGLNKKSTMPEWPAAPPRSHAPPPAPTTEPVAAKVPAPAPAMPAWPPLNERATPATASARPAAAPKVPSTPQKPYRFVQTWVVNPEAEMRALLQSLGAPSDPNTVAHVLMHENPEEEFKAIVRRARAPA